MSTALKWKLAAGFLLVFIAGGMTGGWICSSHAHHGFLGPPHSGALAQQMAERLRSELGLTSDQFAKLSPIIDQAANRLETIRTETARRVSQTMVEAHKQMLPNLTPEQRKKLDAMEQRHRQHAHHRGFPPPRGNEPTP